jgi:hypothetical protein
VLADRVQLTRQLTEAATSAEIVADKLERADRDLIEARMALGAQGRQTELLAGQLTGVGAERDKLTQEKLALAQDNAVLRERALAAGKRTNHSAKLGG